MKFHDLHERLRLETWRRIDQGVLSSSLLARKTGLAQAHISNFLHGRRQLSLPALDRVLRAEALSVEDLSAADEAVRPGGQERASMDVVAVVSHHNAMTAPIVSSRMAIERLYLPGGWLARLPARRAMNRRSWERFVGVRVGALQALPMDPILRNGSIAVLDRHYNSLTAWKWPNPNLYGVRAGSQMLFRHVAFEANRLILRPRALDHPVEVVELSPEESPSDLLVGRVCLCVTEL